MVPEDSVLNIFIMLFKKSDCNDFGNYRAICLLPHAYKLLSAIIARRLHLQLAEYFLIAKQASDLHVVLATTSASSNGLSK